MTPNILTVMGWFKESSEFMWFDLGSVESSRYDTVLARMSLGDIPLVLHTPTLPKDLPLPFEQLGVVAVFYDAKKRPMLTAVTFNRTGNELQVVFRHPTIERLVLTHVGDKSLLNTKDLWYDGDALARLVKLDPFKDKPDPEQAVIEFYTDLSRNIYAFLYIELVQKKVKLPSYQPLPNPSNAKRLAKGKKPLFEWKVIDITANHVLPENSAPTGRSHASPRRHMRRGHMRRYKTGKVAWVKQTMVGKIEFGYIHHSYTSESQHA